ncbi:MAG: hypothetical protein JW731_00060 [Bacteroidales bacterium]|nr:hypothetical protein [Bacteroidales bacterium]
MAGTIILVILFILILWFLTAPIYLCIDTTEKAYYGGIRGIVKIFLVEDEEALFILHIRWFLMDFRINPFKEKVLKPKKDQKRPSKRKRSKPLKLLRLVMKMSWNSIRSFKLKKLEVNLDTDDVIWNGYLVPVFIYTNQKKSVQFDINYSGQNNIILIIENRLITLLFNNIRTYLKHKIN